MSALPPWDVQLASNMCPRDSICDLGDTVALDSKAPRDDARCFSALVVGSVNLGSNVLSKNGVVAFASTAHSSLISRVAHVVGLRAAVDVVPTHTPWSIAQMSEDSTLGKLSPRKNPSDAMGVLFLKNSVAILWAKWSRPNPTRTKVRHVRWNWSILVNLAPKLLFSWCHVAVQKATPPALEVNPAQVGGNQNKKCRNLVTLFLSADSKPSRTMDCSMGNVNVFA